MFQRHSVLGEEDFLMRMAAMFVLSTLAAIYLLFVARREAKRLDRLAIETRAHQQEEKAQKARAGQ